MLHLAPATKVLYKINCERILGNFAISCDKIANAIAFIIAVGKSAIALPVNSSRIYYCSGKSAIALPSTSNRILLL